MKIVMSREVKGNTPIPVRVRRYLNENHMGEYSDAQTLEELRIAHAQRLLAGSDDTETRGLSYALGMRGLSKLDLEWIAGGGELQSTGWEFEASNQGFSGYDTLTRTLNDGVAVIVHVDDQNLWQYGILDPNSGEFGDGDGGSHHECKAGNRRIIEHWCEFILRSDPPTDQDFEKIEP